MILNELKKSIADQTGYLQSIKESGKRIIGNFCSYTPEEIIHASGANPVRLFGTEAEISLADAHLQAYCCSLVRGALEQGLSGKLDYLDGTVFPHTCDSMQRLSDIWRLNTDFKFFSDIVFPVKLNTESAFEYIKDILQKFRKDLEKGFNIEITDDNLWDSIRIYNKIRKSLNKIYELHSDNPELISGRDLYIIMKSCMIFDRAIQAEKLEVLVNEIKDGKYKAQLNNEKRIIISGSICTHPDIYGILEEAGGTVVWDDLCTGTRYFESEISETGDPITAIAGRYVKRPVCPAKHISLTSRGEYLVKSAKQKKAHGVIFLHLKFCDPHSFDYPYLKEYLDKEKIPSTLIEIEEHQIAEGQLRTRFETFVEMI